MAVEAREQGEATQEAEHALSQLLRQLKVGIVCCVDDEYDPAGAAAATRFESLSSWIGQALAAADPDVVGRLQDALPGFPLDAEDEGWRDLLRDWWEQEATLKERGERAAAVATALGRTTGAQEPSLTRMKDFLGPFAGEVQVIEWAPQKWKDSWHEVLAQATENRRLLCLFDQDLSGCEIDGVRQGEESGIKLLQEVLDANKEAGSDRVYCALLSGKFTKNQEETRWRGLAEEHALPLSKVLPISKDRLDDPLDLAHGVKLAAVNLNHELLKDQVARVGQKAVAAAMADLRTLSVWDFNHIVLNTSRREGVWEAETLFRIHDLYMRRARRAAVLEDDERSFFDKLSDLVMAISEVDTGTPAEPSPKVRTIRRLELYQEAEEVNPFHLPIELGDLFEREGKDRDTFVLLAQPCDLTVRGDTGSRILGSAILVPVRAERQPREYRDIYPECLYFLEADDGLHRYFDFPNAVEVSLDLLDLAVFNPDGACMIRHLDPAPERLFQPWKTRYGQVANRFQVLEEPVRLAYHAFAIAQEGETKKDAARRANRRDTVVQQLLSCFALQPTFVAATYEPDPELKPGGKFIFRIRRSGRFLPPAAHELLGKYEAYRARVAADHDFAEQQAKRKQTMSGQSTAATSTDASSE